MDDLESRLLCKCIFPRIITHCVSSFLFHEKRFSIAQAEIDDRDTTSFASAVVQKKGNI